MLFRSIGTLINSPLTTDTPLVEIGYILTKDAWGKGYATEISREVFRWAFANTDLETVYAKTGADNTASQRVLEKLNMRFLKSINIEGRKGQLYSLDKKTYLDILSK